MSQFESQNSISSSDAAGGGRSPADHGPAYDATREIEHTKNLRDAEQHLVTAFINSIERLEQVLELETAMLQRQGPVRLHDFNHKKSRGLLEFSRAMSALRGLDPAAADGAAKAPLIRLRTKLDANLKIIHTHLGAVGAIAAAISRAIQDFESDGTYTRALRDEGRRK